MIVCDGYAYIGCNLDNKASKSASAARPQSFSSAFVNAGDSCKRALMLSKSCKDETTNLSNVRAVDASLDKIGKKLATTTSSELLLTLIEIGMCEMINYLVQ